jgi:hypothetical protein
MAIKGGKMREFKILKPYEFMGKKDIEEKAENILRRIQNTSNYQLNFPLDTSRVAEFLGLDVVWDYIPDDHQGKIAARILPLDNLIEINDRIPQLKDGFAQSTIAHEIGHWVLHFNPIALDSYGQLKTKGMPIKIKPFTCRNSDQANGREWQAQYFASCLLMPRNILLEVKKDKDLRKWQHLYQMADELGVTISNLRHRLKDLGWILT